MATYEDVDKTIELLCNKHIEALDPNNDNPQDSEKLMMGFVVSHCLTLMLNHEFSSQQDRHLLNEEGELSEYVLARFQEAIDDYSAFKAEFFHKGGKMFVPDDDQLPYFEFNPKIETPKP